MNAVDSVRLNPRNQKLHVRTFPPAGQPKAVLVWHHGKSDQDALQMYRLCLRVLSSFMTAGSRDQALLFTGYGEHILRYNHCKLAAKHRQTQANSQVS